MSVRAIAIHSGPRSFAAARLTDAGSARPRRRTGRRASFLGALADDRKLIGVKIILIGVLFLTAMALEVPW